MQLYIRYNSVEIGRASTAVNAIYIIMSCAIIIPTDQRASRRRRHRRRHCLYLLHTALHLGYLLCNSQYAYRATLLVQLVQPLAYRQIHDTGPK